MTNKLDYKIILSIAILLAVIGVFGVLWQKPWQVIGSTIQGNDYFATSTKNFDGTALTSLTRLKDAGNSCVSGALARVTITGAGAGVIKFWDATTTNPLLRAEIYSSSTIFLAGIPASAAANTYDFDLAFNCGLIYEVTGTAPTSTIMWR